MESRRRVAGGSAGNRCGRDVDRGSTPLLSANPQPARHHAERADGRTPAWPVSTGRQTPCGWRPVPKTGEPQGACGSTPLSSAMDQRRGELPSAEAAGRRENPLEGELDGIQRRLLTGRGSHGPGDRALHLPPRERGVAGDTPACHVGMAGSIPAVRSLSWFTVAALM